MIRSAFVRGCVLVSLASPVVGAQPQPPAQAQAQTPAQAPPSTDIWVATLGAEGESLSIGAAENVTDRPGYDNQPWFLPDGRTLLYTSRRGTQTDIYALTLASRATRQVTNTPESEYSPTLTPDGTTISVIRVEADGTQRLWRFPLEGAGDPSLILADVAPVGYHAWGNDTTLALFVLGQPATLRIASLATHRAEVAARDIGRSLHAMPGAASFSFTERTGERQFTLKRIDIASRAIVTLIALPEGAQDYAWTPGGLAIAAAGDRLVAWRQGWTAWRDVAFAKPAGMGAISRLAVSPAGDRVALVASER